MAGAAAFFRRNAVTPAGGGPWRREFADAFSRREHGVAAVGVPYVTSKTPGTVGAALQETRLQGTAVREFLPEFGAAREFQASGVEASMLVPGGSQIQRRLAAPSDHKGYCGENGSTPEFTFGQ